MVRSNFQVLYLDCLVVYFLACNVYNKSILIILEVNCKIMKAIFYSIHLWATIPVLCILLYKFANFLVQINFSLLITVQCSAFQYSAAPSLQKREMINLQ